MQTVKAYAAPAADRPLAPFALERRSPGSRDVVIDIRYCGVCHSDIHQARNEWGQSNYPLVPGHEIVGIVARVGENVRSHRVGDRVGVGCYVDSCRVCEACRTREEQFCPGVVFTYNSVERDGRTRTYGGYSTTIVVDEAYVVCIPPSLPLDATAPLLCAGITTYSPLRHWAVGAGQRVGVLGLGGLGHMAVKIAAALGAEVTVFSTSNKKRDDALRFGAATFVNSSAQGALTKYDGYFDFILNTISAGIDLNAYLGTLKRDSTMVLLGAPDKPAPLGAFPLIMRRRRLAGSIIGGTKETEDMLNFCADHRIASEIETIPMDQINAAFERVVRGDVRYRFVIDLKSLQ